MTLSAYKKSMLALLVLGALLRLILAWVNPPMNAFDDHFVPIQMIMQSGDIPGKRDCWQCYQPPIFYYSSALIGLAATKLGLAASHVPKLLQMLACVYAVLGLWLVYLILNRLPFSNFSRFVAFAVICLLPRHIYMSAMHSNDSLAVMLVALCLYLLLRAMDKGFSLRNILALSTAMVAAIFTKYTAFVVLPMALVAVILLAKQGTTLSRAKLIQLAGLTLLLPLLLLGGYMYNNQQVYGELLPWNDRIVDTARIQAGAKGGISFLDFKPWTVLEAPLVLPANVGSFWTLIHGRMWFDMEPKFILLTERDLPWWQRYFGWLRGHNAFPDSIKLSMFTRVTGAGLVLLGLFPLALMLLGGVRLLRGITGRPNAASGVGSTAAAALLVLILFNVAGIIALAMKAPAYSSIKAIYFLTSLPAAAAFIASGTQWLEGNRAMKGGMLALLGGLLVLLLLHLYQVIHAFIYFA